MLGGLISFNLNPMSIFSYPMELGFQAGFINPRCVAGRVAGWAPTLSPSPDGRHSGRNRPPLHGLARPSPFHCPQGHSHGRYGVDDIIAKVRWMCDVRARVPVVMLPVGVVSGPTIGSPVQPAGAGSHEARVLGMRTSALRPLRWHSFIRWDARCAMATVLQLTARA